MDWIIPIGIFILFYVSVKIFKNQRKHKSYNKNFKKSAKSYTRRHSVDAVHSYRRQYNDPIKYYLTREELIEFTNSHKYQLALDRYKTNTKTDVEIGRMYERYIGHTYELKNYNVTFEGILKGRKDMGRDLIVKNSAGTQIIQAKYWASHKQINANYIYKLFETTETYMKNTAKENITPVFYTTANYSSEAIFIAEKLKVELVYLKYDRDYPMIKCNINSKGDKIYFLPFDSYYDKIKIDLHKKEFYAHTIEEAENANFRRTKFFAPKYKKAAV